MAFKYVETLCPECGGQMVPRDGKFGKFWGCKNFPECKGTRDSNGDSKYDRARAKGENTESLIEEMDKHDIKEQQKCSFTKRAK